ncbi:MAG: glutamate--tRNA ligase, partial [Rhodospirillales bacterium]
FKALGAAPSEFAHLPLLTDISGKGLSKRSGSITLESMRESGIEAMALNNFLGQLGGGDNETVHSTLEALAQEFDITQYGRGTPKFDQHQLDIVNARILHELPFDLVRERLAAMDLPQADETFWLAVRANLEKLEDIRVWHAVCFDTLETPIDDASFIESARNLLPEDPWDEGTWKIWTQAVGQETERKGKNLFLPLRRTLTGHDHGPELKVLLPIMGRARVLERLQS